MRAIIVGDGPSARGFVPPAGVTVIAVKRTITWLKRADYWFSLDPNHASMNLMRRRVPGVRYVCACDDPDILPDGVEFYRRVAAPPGNEPRRSGSPEWWLWRWSAMLGLCERPGHIHSGNSAWGALGLAYHLGARDVLLVGVDGTCDARVSDGRTPNNLSHLPRLFESAMGQVCLFTVGRLGKVPQTTVTEWLEASCKSTA